MNGGIESPRRPVRRALVLAATLAAAAGVLAGSAGGTGRYVDPAGDSGAAPDVTGATVSSTADGQIVFRIGITNLPASGDVRTVVLVDSDANPDSGKVESAG